VSAGHVHIGTSGWSYAHWAGGRFYPKGLKPGEWLAFFSRRFHTVEVNSSFYRLPRKEVVERWRDVTDGRFRFAVKLWRMITHRKKLADCSDLLETFMDVVDAFGRKRGPLLVQLPPSMGKDVDRLVSFLRELRALTRAKRWRIAVEFRNPSWLCTEVYRALDHLGVAVCLADMERCPITEPNEVGFVYVRRHGPGGRYRGCYSSEHIAADAKRIRGWLRDGRDVYVYYNNDVGGHAVDNAGQLIEALEDARN